ncbi:ABC transporter ATP-binding protein [Corynebacterium phocae]|uniref:ABC transporter ATP-binding protein n=1 Tax=Corynebacterium phocae TaxID=161895 RepID=A0A1L7D201_9CORY|nr:ABC transporter ATP-binding protein [Corynebacterium phocae]APT92097.1 ABC transporter ATP-binding protein [Corynebacterium phocae]KAA8726481.1 ABC transporter ATP-binding protein [Corynebacterium phocae]
MLKVRDLTVSTRSAELLHRLTFAVAPGGRLGLIGESGSGKSLTALAIMGLLAKNLRTGGSVLLDGDELVGLPDRALRGLRGKKMAMVFQEPMSALDPLMTIGRQLGFAGASAQALTSVGLDPALSGRFPHQLSGGQRQRVLIAMAMAGNPDLLICDEPTTALDATTQADILELIDRLVTEHGTALLFISHDLRVIARMCTSVVVMHAGRAVEQGPTREVLSQPREDYTRALVSASLPGEPAPPRPATGTAIELRNVTKSYRGRQVLDGVSLHVARGQRLGLVGGSGSGKTTLIKLVAGLAQPTSGTVAVTGRVQMVFQDPQSSLNPRLPVWKIVAEGKRGATRSEVESILAEVGIDPSGAGRYPHEFSGGQRQRISIARAVIGDPDILLADEAVSALDVSVRRTILDLLAKLVDSRGLTLVFVTHDLAVMRQVCDTVAVLHAGQLVETGRTEDIWANPADGYTRALIDAAAAGPLPTGRPSA